MCHHLFNLSVEFAAHVPLGLYVGRGFADVCHHWVALGDFRSHHLDVLVFVGTDSWSHGTAGCALDVGSDAFDWSASAKVACTQELEVGFAHEVGGFHEVGLVANEGVKCLDVGIFHNLAFATKHSVVAEFHTLRIVLVVDKHCRTGGGVLQQVVLQHDIGVCLIAAHACSVVAVAVCAADTHCVVVNVNVLVVGSDLDTRRTC